MVPFIRQHAALCTAFAPGQGAEPVFSPLACSIGAPESTLELEVSFSSLGELEEFWSSIPQVRLRHLAGCRNKATLVPSPLHPRHPFDVPFLCRHSTRRGDSACSSS